MVEKQKRGTIFPGSDQWTGSRQLRDSPVKIGEAPLDLSVPKPFAKKLINIPINPSSPYGDFPVPLLKESPWKYYQSGYSLELGGSIAVVRNIPATEDLFALRSFSSTGADKKLYMLSHLKHDNLLAPKKVFAVQDTYYLISEHVEISCEEFIVARPDEIQVAAIISQMLKPISYLVEQKLTHSAINCSNILLTKAGVVKLANWENCTKRSSQNRFEDIEALGQVMKQLMEMGSENGRLGLRQPLNWSEKAVNFLTLTMTASPAELAQHPFLENPHQIHELVWLISLAQRSASWLYSVVAANTLSIVMSKKGDDPSYQSHWSIILHGAGVDRGNLLQLSPRDRKSLQYQFSRRDNVAILSSGSTGYFQVATLPANLCALASNIIRNEPVPRSSKDQSQDWIINCLISLETEELVPLGTSKWVHKLIAKSTTELAQILGRRWVANNSRERN